MEQEGSKEPCSERFTTVRRDDVKRPSRKFELRSPAATKSRNSGARHRTADPDHYALANVDAGEGQDDEKRVQFAENVWDQGVVGTHNTHSATGAYGSW